MHRATKHDNFLSVLEANKGIIYKVANAYCADSENRKDLVQEITIHLWKSFDYYSVEYKYSTWIYRIALNVAISFYRKENRRKKVSNPLEEGLINLIDTEPADETTANLAFLQQIIAELRELDRALMLLYLEEKSHKEIAEIVGISVTNVATRIGRIKKQLQQKFLNLKH